jgi:hypothetical protein
MEGRMAGAVPLVRLKSLGMRNIVAVCGVGEPVDEGGCIHLISNVCHGMGWRREKKRRGSHKEHGS